MTVAVLMPLIKLLVTTLVTLVAVSFIVSISGDFLNINTLIPMFIAVGVTVAFFYPQLSQQLRERLQLIFN